MTREPEWDDYEREKMAALALYEAGVCDCGFHQSLARDRRLWFQPEIERCDLCASLDSWMRGLESEDRKADEQLKDAPTARRPADGRKIAVRRMSDDEVAAYKSTRAPSGRTES